MAEKEFISIKKAAKLTGKPEQKLLKIWALYQATNKVREKNGKRYISRTLLKKASTKPLPIDDPPETATYQPSASVSADSSPVILELLTRQLQEKDKQIAARDTQIAQLIERTREQNNIIFSLEQHQQLLESKRNVQLPGIVPEEKPERSRINYVFIGLVMLLVGVVLIIFYTLLTS